MRGLAYDPAVVIVLRCTYRADRSHSMVNTTWSQTSLDDFEATAFSKDHVALVDADIVE